MSVVAGELTGGRSLEVDLNVGVVHEAAHEGEHEGDRPAINRFGLRLFILSESMLFAALVAGRFYLAGLSRPDSVNVGLGLLMTLALLGSSGLSYRGLAALRRGDRGAAVRSLTGTILLGVLFLVGVGFEWSAAIREFGPSTSYGTAFFATTGLHASHLASGLVVLVLLARLIRRGHFQPGADWGAVAAVTYWTFVDAMWVLVIFPTLYLA